MIKILFEKLKKLRLYFVINRFYVNAILFAVVFPILMLIFWYIYLN